MITCIGTIIADILIKPVDKLPKAGELELTDDICLSPGGSAANTAVMLSRTGSKVNLLGSIGNDSLGSYLLGEYDKENVNSSGIKIYNEVNSTAILVIINKKGERSFIAKYGAERIYNIDSIAWDVISKSKHLHFGGYYTFKNLVSENAAILFKKAKEFKVITSLDTIWDHTGNWMNNIKPVLPYVDFFMTNRDEGFHITGEKSPENIAKVLLDSGGNTIIVKLDKEGCYICNKEIKLKIPAYVTESIDSTGSGDAFASGFITGLNRNLPLDKCCKLANAYGSLNIRKMGATGGIEFHAQIKSFIKDVEPALLDQI